MFLPSHKVQDLFQYLEGMLEHVGQCSLCMHLSYRSLIMGNQMSILRHVNVVNLAFEIRYELHNILFYRLGLHLCVKPV